MKNEDWYTTGGYFKNGLFLSYRESTKGQQKTPVSRRENGVLESGTEGTRTLDLRLDRTERFISTNGGSDSVFER